MFDSIIYVRDFTGTKPTKHGFGGISGTPPGCHRKCNPRTMINLLHGNGCSKGGTDCFNCHLPECRFDYMRDFRKIHNG